MGVASVLDKYFDDISPVDGKPFAKDVDSTTKDVELALDAAYQAKDVWVKTSLTKRADILLKIADRLEANLELLAVAETWENDKPIRETFVQYRQETWTNCHHLPCPCGVWRLQTIRHWARKP